MVTADRYTLVHGDCFEHLDKFSGAGLILTDLPFNVSSRDWDKDLDIPELFERFNRIRLPEAPIVLFGTQPFSSKLVMAGLDQFKFALVWAKNKSSGHLNAKTRPMKKHEDILVFGGREYTYNPIESEGHKPMSAATNTVNASFYNAHGGTRTEGGKTTRLPTSLLEFPVVNNDGTTDGGRFHPSQKPLSLLSYLIRMFSNPGDLVVDATMGSGSTGVAALQCGRRFAGIELDAKWYQDAVSRLEGLSLSF